MGGNVFQGPRAFAKWLAGTSSPRKKFAGAPFHGVVLGDLLTLPNAATKNYNWLNSESGFTRVNSHAAIPFKRRGQPAVPARTPEEAAIDTAKGLVWKDYGLIVGHFKRVWGAKFTGDVAHEMTLPRNGWLYSDDNGDNWVVDCANRHAPFSFGAAFSVDLTFKRFGLLRSRASRNSLNPPVFTVTVSFPKPAGWTYGGNIVLYPGTWSIHGDKCCVYAVAPESCSLGGGAGELAPFHGGSGFGQGPKACWLVTLSGVPGAGLTAVPVAKGPTDTSGNTPASSVYWKHTWVTPGGVVHDTMLNTSFSQEQAGCSTSPGAACGCATSVGGGGASSAVWNATLSGPCATHSTTSNGTTSGSGTSFSCCQSIGGASAFGFACPSCGSSSIVCNEETDPCLCPGLNYLNSCNVVSAKLGGAQQATTIFDGVTIFDTESRPECCAGASSCCDWNPAYLSGFCGFNEANPPPPSTICTPTDCAGLPSCGTGQCATTVITPSINMYFNGLDSYISYKITPASYLVTCGTNTACNYDAKFCSTVGAFGFTFEPTISGSYFWGQQNLFAFDGGDPSTVSVGNRYRSDTTRKVYV